MMRFLELRAEEGQPPLRLHPRLTLLQGLDPAARVALVGFLHSVAVGETLDWSGTVDVHGVEMDLGSALELVGATADAALIVEAQALVDVTLEADPASTVEAEAVAEARGERERLETEIADLADELSGAARIRQDMLDRLDAASAMLRPDAGASLDRRDGELQRAARAAGADPWSGGTETDERAAFLDALIGDIDETLESLPSGDRSVLAAAIATARAAIVEGEVPCPDAAALLEAWTSLHQRLEGIESRVEADGGGTDAVAGRLEAARVFARVADDAATLRAVEPEEFAHLEQLHDRVLELEQKAGKGVRRGAARREFEAAQQVLSDALDEIGYPTWAAFRLGNGYVAVGDQAAVASRQARQELEAAESEWADVEARRASDTELQSVLSAIEVVGERAAALLGDDEDTPLEIGSDDPGGIADRLRDRTVPSSSVPVARNDALDNLRTRLDETGSIGHQDVASDAGLVGLGETWLRVLVAADAAAVRLLRDRERATEQLAALTDSAPGPAGGQFESERAAVHAAEEEVGEHRSALFDISRARLELHMLLATELAVAEDHDEKLELLAATRMLEEVAQAELDAAAGRPCGVNAVAARVPRGTGGAIPVVVLMGGAPISALDSLDEMPDDVQVIVLGDAAGMADWVAGRPAGSVLLVECSTMV